MPDKSPPIEFDILWTEEIVAASKALRLVHESNEKDPDFGNKCLTALNVCSAALHEADVPGACLVLSSAKLIVRRKK